MTRFAHAHVNWQPLPTGPGAHDHALAEWCEANLTESDLALLFEQVMDRERFVERDAAIAMLDESIERAVISLPDEARRELLAEIRRKLPATMETPVNPRALREVVESVRAALSVGIDGRHYSDDPLSLVRVTAVTSDRGTRLRVTTLDGCVWYFAHDPRADLT